MTKKKNYRTSVHIGYVNGKRITKTICASSEKELKLKKADLISSLKAGKNVYTKATFQAWAEKWYSEVKEPASLSNGTLTQYLSAIAHLNAAFGDKQLKDIKLSDFQTFINSLAKNNPNTGMPSSKATLNSIKKVAGAIFDYADSNNIDGCPRFIKSIVIPKSAPVNPRRALTEEEIQWIIDTPHKAQLPAMIMLFTGLRRGELFALRWSDIDFENNLLHVYQSVEIIGNKSRVKQGGKTANAKRIIPMPSVLVEYLKDYKKSLKTISTYVCTNAKGKIFTKSSFDSLWNSYICDLNIKYGYNNRINKFNPKKGPLPMKIERFTPHYLRHTFATLLYLQGVDIVTAKQLLGHADIKTTINIYTDLNTFNKATLSAQFNEKLVSDYAVRVS